MNASIGIYNIEQITMATFFIIIIYLAFISLRLPDSLLGSAWPVMRMDLNASLGTAGILSMVIAGSTIVSSLVSGVVLHLFPGKISGDKVILQWLVFNLY